MSKILTSLKRILGLLALVSFSASASESLILKFATESDLQNFVSQPSTLNRGLVIKESFEAFGEHYAVMESAPSHSGIRLLGSFQPLASDNIQHAEINQTYYLFGGAPPPDDLEDFNPKPVLPNEKTFGNQWGVLNFGQTINSNRGVRKRGSAASQAWNITRGSRNVIVGVMDTGIDYNHKDLEANLWSQTVNGRKSYGYNAIDQNFDVMDGHSHGTHVAGTIGAAGNNGTGVVGVNWNVRIASVKIFDSNGRTTTAAILRGLDWFYQRRGSIRIINHSWGGGGFSQLSFEAFKRLDNAGVVNVIAAGNNGRRLIPDDRKSHNGDSIYPAQYKLNNSIVVAAHANNGRKASFSNYGSDVVDIAAPGVDILSTTPRSDIGYKSGTSMAAPHVAGAAALVKAAHPSASASQIKRRILNGAWTWSELSGVSNSSRALNVFRAVR